MPPSIPFLTEGLPIRRLGIVAQATVTIWRDDADPAAAGKPESRLLPITFPTQFPLEGGWRLQHASPTTGQLVTENALIDLFQNSPSRIRLFPTALYNLGLLDSLAAAFADVPGGAYRAAGPAGADWTAPPLPGGSPSLTYYRPLEAPQEQYLLLHRENFAPGERPDEEPSFASLYALVQVELDEERFLFLLRQALDAAYAAR